MSLDIRYLCVIFSHRSLIYCSLISLFQPSPSLLHPSVLLYFPAFHSCTRCLPPYPWCLLIATVHTRASLNVLAFMSCLSWQGRSTRYCKLIRLSPPPFVRVCEVNYYYISPLSDSRPPPPPPESFFGSLYLVLVILMASAWLNTGLRAD